MANTQFGERIASIQCNYINKELRGGMIVFGDETYTAGTTAEDYEGRGFSFLVKFRTTDYGDTYGGYVSGPKLDKDAQEYPESFFYINLNPYVGENDKIAYLVSVTEVNDGEFGEKIFGGILYKSGIAGFCQGTLSTLKPADDEEEEVKSKRSRGKQTKSKPTSRASGKKPKYSKPDPNIDEDDIPY